MALRKHRVAQEPQESEVSIPQPTKESKMSKVIEHVKANKWKYLTGVVIAATAITVAIVRKGSATTA